MSISITERSFQYSKINKLKSRLEDYYSIKIDLIKEGDKKSIDYLKRSIRTTKRELDILTEKDLRLVNYLTDSSKAYTDSFTELFIIEAITESDVWQFIHDNSLNTEYIECQLREYDCTGQTFGGAPCIRKLTNNRYVLSYHWYLDV